MILKIVCGLCIAFYVADASLIVVGNLAVVGKPKSFVGTHGNPVLAHIGKLWCGAQILGEKTPIAFGQFRRSRDGKVFEGGLTDHTTFLDINNAPATVAGKYTCEIRTQDEQIATGNCFIYLPPILQLPSGSEFEEVKDTKIATVIVPPKVIKSGESIRLHCPVYGYPPPYVTWSKDGETLGSDVSYEGDDIIIQAIPESAGEYVCQGDNSFPMFVDGPAMPHALIYKQKLVVM